MTNFFGIFWKLEQHATANFNSHTRPGPLKKPTTAFNSPSVKRVSSPET